MGQLEREMLLALADMSPGALGRQTGLSVGYRRRIKTGQAVPHPMWRERLQAEPTTPSALR